MFSKGDRVLVDHHNTGETIEAMFLEPGAPDDAIEQDGRRVDVGWVQYDSGELQGTTGKPILGAPPGIGGLRSRQKR